MSCMNDLWSFFQMEQSCISHSKQQNWSIISICTSCNISKFPFHPSGWIISRRFWRKKVLPNHSDKEQTIPSSPQNDEKLDENRGDRKIRKYTNRITWTKTLNPPHINPTEKDAYIDAWHNTLNHISLDKLRQIARTKYIPELSDIRTSNDMVITCAACAHVKYQQPTPYQTNQHSYTPDHILSSDVMGFLPIISTQGHKFVLTAIDKATLHAWTTPLKSCSEASTKLINLWHKSKSRRNAR